eukprot:767570-Hanusia_phi.AAC.1
MASSGEAAAFEPEGHAAPGCHDHGFSEPFVEPLLRGPAARRGRNLSEPLPGCLRLSRRSNTGAGH